MEEMALLLCPKTHISIEIKDPTIPTAPKLSTAFNSILPIIAVSVIDKIGSAIPEINAGIASLLIRLKLISVLKKNKINSTQKYDYQPHKNLNSIKNSTFA